MILQTKKKANFAKSGTTEIGGVSWCFSEVSEFLKALFLTSEGLSYIDVSVLWRLPPALLPLRNYSKNNYVMNCALSLTLINSTTIM